MFVVFLTAMEPNISRLCLTCTYSHTSVKLVGLVGVGGLLRPKVTSSSPGRGTKHTHFINAECFSV